jgi:hypothetical protein
MSEREVMRKVFSGIVNNPSVTKKGLAQLALLKQEKEGILKGKVTEFYASLRVRYPKYINGKENTNENENINDEDTKKVFQNLEKEYLTKQPMSKKTTIQSLKKIPNGLNKPKGLNQPKGLNKPKATAVTIEENEFPVVRRDTKTQGDCFFSSIYRAAKEQNLLDILEDCLEVETSQEEIFIQNVRDILADKILEDEDGVISDIYENLTNLSEININSFGEIMNGMPSWFRKEFEDGFPEDVEEFVDIIAENERKSGNYVGEIEVNIIKKVIEECGIHLEIYVTPIQKAKKETEEGEPILHLLHIGPPDYEEGHYEYYSFLSGNKGGSK